MFKIGKSPEGDMDVYFFKRTCALYFTHTFYK